MRLCDTAQQFVNMKMRDCDSAILLIYLNTSKLPSWFTGLLVCCKAIGTFVRGRESLTQWRSLRDCYAAAETTLFRIRVRCGLRTRK